MDQRGAGGQKRSRADASQGEGDWTCPQCGNVNFAFRNTCNIRKCGASKPSHASQRGPINASIYEPVPTPLYMGGPGAPPSVPMGMSAGYGIGMPSSASLSYEYGASLGTPSYNGASSYGPPNALIGGGLGYGAPGYNAGSGYGTGSGYGGGSGYGAASGYGMASVYGTAPGYGTGTGIGFGTASGYGSASSMDGHYGMGLGMSRGQLVAGPGSGLYMEENGSRKRRGAGASEGDWTCPKCGNSNFAFRDICNMRKCGTTKPAAAPPIQAKTSDATTPDGSWTCEKCGNINYPFRTKCNRKSCGAEKPAPADRKEMSSTAVNLSSPEEEEE